MPNILTNGSTVCLSTDSNEQLEISVFNKGSATATGVTVTITIPAGLAFEPGVPSQGAFDDGTGVWDVGALLTSQNESNPETFDPCFTVVDATQAPFVITWVVSCDDCPDHVHGNDDGQRTIEGIACPELEDCFTSLFSSLVEYDSMADAVLALGEGKPFLASLDNTEGWSYRTLLVTPFS